MEHSSGRSGRSSTGGQGPGGGAKEGHAIQGTGIWAQDIRRPSDAGGGNRAQGTTGFSRSRARWRFAPPPALRRAYLLCRI
eukprot:scaffold31667_cov107-Isochrysis_galbana.AAC.3